MKHPDESIMRRAIEIAMSNHKQGGHAIGALVVGNGHIIAEGATTLATEFDPTAHAEINAIREASRKLSSRYLPDCYLYTTYEPCPMCTSAAIWAKMAGIVYGASRLDRTKSYSWRVEIPAAEVLERGEPKLDLHPEFLRDDCKKLLQLPIG